MNSNGSLIEDEAKRLDLLMTTRLLPCTDDDNVIEPEWISLEILNIMLLYEVS